jgi:hypothetical protein
MGEIPGNQESDIKKQAKEHVKNTIEANASYEKNSNEIYKVRYNEAKAALGDFIKTNTRNPEIIAMIANSFEKIVEEVNVEYGKGTLTLDELLVWVFDSKESGEKYIQGAKDIQNTPQNDAQEIVDNKEPSLQEGSKFWKISKIKELNGALYSFLHEQINPETQDLLFKNRIFKEYFNLLEKSGKSFEKARILIFKSNINESEKEELDVSLEKAMEFQEKAFEALNTVINESGKKYFLTDKSEKNWTEELINIQNKDYTQEWIGFRDN